MSKLQTKSRLVSTLKQLTSGQYIKTQQYRVHELFLQKNLLIVIWQYLRASKAFEIHKNQSVFTDLDILQSRQKHSSCFSYRAQPRLLHRRRISCS